jgi:hypothetical protein
MVFSDTSGGLGIVQQVRNFMRVDSTQWATSKIVNSVNNYLERVAGYAIGADRRFQWDDTNHTKLPIGTTNLVANQSDYSFLTDEQGNRILTLTRIDVLDPGGEWRELMSVDQVQIPMALDEWQKTAGLPTHYDKIADNIIRLYPKPANSVTSGLKFYFQRSPSYFSASDTTKEPGVAPTLHEGFVIKAAYDGAITLGLPNTQALSVEMQRQEQIMKDYFTIRTEDEPNKSIRPVFRSSR